jgi:quercetin dioxygenase-like cupin family protein
MREAIIAPSSRARRSFAHPWATEAYFSEEGRTLKIRRVVTSHDADGKAVVAIDEISRDVVSHRKGATFANIWSTSGFPVDNSDPADGAKQIGGTTRQAGTVFRVIEYAPGVAPRNHRTSSIDYAVVLSGEIDMEMDSATVHLRAGDVLVQRGTIHNWVNQGDKPCVITFVLIDAGAVKVQGRPLDPIG